MHIQRVVRGRAARKCAALISIARDVPVPPLPPVSTPSAASRQHGDGDGFAVSESATTAGDVEEAGSDPPLLGSPVEGGGREQLPSPAGASASSDLEPPVAEFSKREVARRHHAASRIQVLAVYEACAHCDILGLELGEIAALSFRMTSTI